MNRMKKMAYMFAAVSLLSSCNYDDTKLWDAVNSQEERISALEKWSEGVNAQLAALQTLVQCEDFVTSVEPIMKDGKQVGYKINFHSAESITLYMNSNNEVEGTNTPDVVPVQVENGRWVWQVNGELLTDANGNYVYVDACTPQLRVNEQGFVEMSVDGGVTWTTIHDKDGNVPGNHQMVTVDESTKDKGYIIIRISVGEDGKMSTDSEIKLPVWSDLASALEEVKDKWELKVAANSTVEVKLSKEKLKDGAIYVANAQGLTATVVDGNKVKLTMNSSNTVPRPNFTLMVSDGWNQTIIRNIYPEMYVDASSLGGSDCANGCKYVTIKGNIGDNVELNRCLPNVKVLDLSEASGRVFMQNANNIETITFVTEKEDGNTNSYNFTNWPFKNCDKLTTVEFPETLTFTNNQFSGFENTKVVSIDIPETVQTIAGSSVKGNSELKTVELPSTIKSIGNEFGANCPKLTEVIINTEIIPQIEGARVFEGTSTNVKIYVPDAAVDAYKAAWASDYPASPASREGVNKPCNITMDDILPISTLNPAPEVK